MRPNKERVLMTGGSGRLGTELRRLLPDLIAPPRRELDITRPETIEAALERYRPTVVLHAAAYTDVAGAERDRETCWQTNVRGTAALVSAVNRTEAGLIHISTDYV
ncbi:MAG TPA: NAD(P)-dependent oxidoreductase, partial [Clostridiales bacterium]|nr:NAD(P)-dependent oxidoreductase [Clostridiales bacterium]